MNRLFSIIFTLSTCGVFAQPAAPYQTDPDTLVQQKLARWQDLKLGFMMHWGAYSQWGVVESWSICSEDWIDRGGADYVDYVRRYELLPTTFNPVHFDPERWAKAAWNAGMRYVVFTTKHHDGFCMYDSKYTDYKITGPDCPFHTHPKADISEHIFEAFREKGFMTGAYFSKPDWHCDDYWAHEWATPDRCNNYDIRKYPERWKRYEDFTFLQIEELLSNYGPMDILWLDGGWVRPDSTINDEVRAWGYNLPKWGQNIDMHRVAHMARRKQPGILIVDRSVHGPYENYRTPEQHVPGQTLPYPWETCMTMAEGWSFSHQARYKPARLLIHTLVDIVSKGGNLLLNVGPGPDGNIDSIAYARLAEIGDWMRVNGDAIYFSQPLAPYRTGNICLTQNATTHKRYLIYLAEETENQLPASIFMNAFDTKTITSVRLLGAPEVGISWKPEDDGIRIDTPKKIRQTPPCAWAWVFEISDRH